MMNWQLFISIYCLIFIAELPDKTAFATLILATRSRALAVFCGVALAFLIQTIVAVLFGRLISLLPAQWVHWGAGLLFILFALHMWRGRNEEEHEKEDPNSCKMQFWPCLWQAFVVIFLAEWGDLTQIATASLVAKYPMDQVTVFAAALCALWSVTALAVVIGQRTQWLLHPATLKRFCAFLFLAIGVYFLAT